MTDRRVRWLEKRLEAQMWWCGDDYCDCTQPVIERITPNHQAGYPWVHRERVWEGEFLTSTEQYSAEEREALQFAPLREACQQFGVTIPDIARDPRCER
jgi:hypothetical protein